METEYYNEICYEKGAVRVLYEDNHIISVVKPRGILSQSDISGDEDLLSLLKKDIAERKNKPGDAFVGLVHRLDRNTGGTMVFAKTSKGASRLSEELRGGRFGKCYFALAEGNVPAEGGIILKNRLEKDEKANAVRESGNGRECLLFIKSLAKKDGYTLVAAVPITGRTHQIRAQLALFGYPLAGDKKYGAKALNGDFLGLWSAVVTVKHPVKDVRLVFESKPPREKFWKIFEEKVYNEAVPEMRDLAEKKYERA